MQPAIVGQTSAVIRAHREVTCLSGGHRFDSGDLEFSSRPDRRVVRDQCSGELDSDKDYGRRYLDTLGVTRWIVLKEEAAVRLFDCSIARSSALGWASV